MPRKKRSKSAPRIIGSFIDDHGHLSEIEVIDQISENFGKGSNRKLIHLKNFEEALEIVASSYYFGTASSHKKYKELIYGNRKKTALAQELLRCGIDIGDRKGRVLALEIQTAIKAYDAALKKIKITGI